ncbi:MAG: ATP-dependent DNA helicase [Myxococcales bacterium]|jgi:ATP-dependent DNA helicase DinG|nr:ATP-dependent DNA helicase [Myxococcales bacterium]
MTAPFQDPILKYLGPHGLLARALDGYEHRPQQLDMARLIRRALDERRYCLIEAGTGTGKTLAYLVPALLSGRRVVVSTATKTLQDQILGKDLPLLARSTGIEFRAVALKGRSNYVCLYRLDQAEEAGQALLLAKDRRDFERVVEWARTTAQGEWAELNLPDKSPIARELSSTSESCLGRKCPRNAQCFVSRARRAAAESDLIIVNHHLLFADLALKTERPGSSAQVIPSYQAVVFDEAHAIEDVATDFFGVSLSNFRVRDLLDDIERVLPTGTHASDDKPLIASLLTKVEALSNRFFNQRGMLLTSNDPARRLTREVDADALAEHSGDLVEALRALTSALEPLEVLEKDALTRRAKALTADLSFFVAVDDPLFVYWEEKRGRGTFLRAAPIDVGGEFRRRLYTTADTIVFTSATLAAEGKLEFTRKRLGLTEPDTDREAPRKARKQKVIAPDPSKEEVRLDSPEAARLATPVDELMLDSPFDFQTQAALYAPTHLPEPSDASFIDAVAEEIVALCDVTGGRALLLFTSLRNMTEAYRRLEHRLPCRAMLQGDAPKSALIAKLQEAPSVLFASHSFWEGVDIPGEALSLVVIDKLPFAAPGDPVVAARVEWISALGRSAFNEYQLPQAALLLRQGFGRLIRTRRDRGIVAVLDPRLSTKRYGQAFLKSLPPARRFGELDALRSFWSTEVVR